MVGKRLSPCVAFLGLFFCSIGLPVIQSSGLSQTSSPLPAVATIPDAWMQKIKWRCIGPANMGGRITAISVYEKDPIIWWAATASGGLLKTVNNGVTFEHQFDRQSTVSIGDVQVAPLDANIVWVGTGEANPRNSVSWGDGVYKSSDGGKSWTHKGLKKSFQIGRIALHPTDPNVVFVGALGRLWGPNEERGLYKSVDGGDNWKRVLYVDDKTGVIDVQIDPSNPNIVLAATYERQRDGFDGNDPIKKYGPGAGVYRSTDGGETFTRVTQGLPSVNMGRIGLCFYAANTSIVYAVVESEKIAKIPEDSPTIAIRTVDAEVGAKIEQVTKDSVAEKAGLKINDIIVQVGDVVIHNSEQFWKTIRKSKAGDKIALEISRERKPVDLELDLEKANVEDGTNDGRSPFAGVLGGQAANLQEQQGSAGAEFGGVYQSTDGGAIWQRINSLNPRPMYYSQIRVDPKDNNNLYILGTSLHRSKDGGKEFTEGGDRGVHPDHHAMWIDPRDPRHMILGNDGGIYVTYDQMETWDHLNHVAIGQFYHVGVDARRDYMVYGGLQDNGSWGGPARGASGSGPVNSDWINVGGGDGFVCFVDPNDPDVVYSESQNGAIMRLNTRTGQQSGIFPRPQQGTKYRFNWKTPFALSPQNARIFYSVGNFVFRSVAAGDALVAISPEITNSSDGSGSAIALSPLEYGVIYAGTTDGAIWMSKDDGKTWTPIFSKPQPKKDEAPNAGQAGPRPGDVKGIAGSWNGKLETEQIPDERRKFELKLAVDDANKISGTYTSPRGTSQIDSGQYDPTTGKLKLEGHNERIKFTIESEIKDSLNLIGTITMGAQNKIAISATRPAPLSPANDMVSGYWELIVNAGGKPEQQQPAVLKLETRADKSIAGTAEIEGRSISVAEAKFDAPRKRLTLNFGDNEHDFEFVGTISGRHIKGSLDVDFGLEQKVTTGWRLPAEAIGKPLAADVLVGTWTGTLESEMIPAPMNVISMTVKEDAAKGFVGEIAAATQKVSIDSGSIDTAKGTLSLNAHNNETSLTITGRIVGDVLVGTIAVPGGAMSFDFAVTKSKPESNSPKQEKESESKGAPADQGEADVQNPSEAQAARTERAPKSSAQSGAPAKPAAGPESPPQEAAAKPDEQADPSKPSALGRIAAEGPGQEKQPDDPIAGRWSGKFIGEMFRGDRGRFEMALQREGNRITGTMNTSRGETKITGGSFDPSSGKLEMTGANETSTIDITATLASGKLTGTAKMGGGRFTVEFEAARPDAAAVGPPGKPLESLVPGPRWVSSLTASRFAASRVYLTLDGHRSDDDAPYVFASEDYGQTWRSLQANIPLEAGTVHALREDPDNENVLYLGCEFSAWVSIDRGQSWTKLSGLPTVAVHDLALHDASHELIAATHGRSLWVADVDVIKQLGASVLNQPTHLFTPNSFVRWRRTPSRGSSGTRRFVGENPSAVANIFYLVNADVGQVDIVIRNIEGTELKTMGGTTEPGLQSVTWDFSADGGREPGRRSRSRGRITPGAYLVELQIDGAVRQRAVLNLLEDPRNISNSGDAQNEQTISEDEEAAQEFPR